MNDHTETGSYFVVKAHPISGSDMAASCGTSVAVRKFDPSVVTPGFWNEMWMCVRGRVSASYNFAGTSSVEMFNELMGNEFGLCVTANAVPGESGSGVDMSGQQCIGMSTYDSSATNLTHWNINAVSHSKVNRVVCGTYHLNGTPTYGTATGGIPLYFVNTTKDAGSLRNHLLIRFYTGSLANQMNMTLLYPSSSNTDASASSMVADLMVAPNWASLVTSASVFGYNTMSLGTFAVSQSQNGYFDGVYFKWHRMWDTLEMHDVVLRPIFSFQPNGLLNGLAHYWKLEDLTDWKGSSNFTRISQSNFFTCSLEHSASGKIGGCYYHNDSGAPGDPVCKGKVFDALTTPSVPSLCAGPGISFTAQAWVFPYSVCQTNTEVFTKFFKDPLESTTNPPFTPEWRLRETPLAVFSFQCGNAIGSASNSMNFTASGNLSNYEWHHLVFGYDAVNQLMFTWCDGKSYQSQSWSDVRASSASVQLFNSALREFDAFQGALDEAAFWYNTVLNGTQVAYLYNSGSGLPPEQFTS